MDLSFIISSMLEDPRPWIIAIITIVAAVIFSLVLLWLFKVTRLIFVKEIDCPEKKQRALVDLIGQVGETGPYYGVYKCSLLTGEEDVTCHKTCLNSPDVLRAPFIALRRS